MHSRNKKPGCKVEVCGGKTKQTEPCSPFCQYFSLCSALCSATPRCAEPPTACLVTSGWSWRDGAEGPTTNIEGSPVTRPNWWLPPKTNQHQDSPPKKKKVTSVASKQLASLNCMQLENKTIDQEGCGKKPSNLIEGFGSNPGGFLLLSKATCNVSLQFLPRFFQSHERSDALTQAPMSHTRLQGQD